MIKQSTLTALLFMALAIGLTARHAQAASILSTWNGPVVTDLSPTETGTLNGRTVTSTPFTFAALFGFDNLSTSPYSYDPKGSSETMLWYDHGDSYTTTFSTPVTGLELYFMNWRNATYTFDHAFTLGSDDGGGQSYTSTTMTVSDGGGSGILVFTGSLSSLTVTPSVIESGAPFNGVIYADPQLSPPSVPEPSTFALGGLGLLGLGCVALRKKYRRA